ncbi:hypothetical protein D3C83_323760 [compost metagenome]
MKDVPEFCPYTAADWWNTNLPETVAAASVSDSPVPAGDSGAGIVSGAEARTSAAAAGQRSLLVRDPSQ